MLGNIIDHRTNSCNVSIDAVFEPSCHDNSVDGSTEFDWSDEFSIDELYDTTVADAVAMAQTKWACPVTVFLYDAGSKPVG